MSLMNIPRTTSVFTLAIAIIIAALPWQTARAGVQDFTIPLFEANYYLSRDAQHISHLRVEERITAEFPLADQNHGILRAIPKTYQKHDTNLRITAVTDTAGHALSYDKSTENDNLVLKIGDASHYVHGRQTYLISYTADDITTQANGYDGFFWDINGDQWQQPFDDVSATIHLQGDLATQYQSGHDRCFTGAHGSTSADCTIKTSTENNEATVSVQTTHRPLSAGETLTAEVGFAPGTFAAYQRPLDDIIVTIILVFLLGVLPIGLTLWITIRRWLRYGRDPRGKGVLIPEYLPPKDLSVLASSAILHESFQPKAISAQIIDLAVRHYLKVYEIKEARILKNKITYEIELTRDPSDLRTEEQAVITMLFGGQTIPGSRVKLTDLSMKLYTQATELGRTVNQQLADSGSFRVTPEKAKHRYLWAAMILLVIGFMNIPVTLGFFICGIIVLIVGSAMPARTAKGVEQRDYLLGLKMYMKLAEADRLKTLQSPHGELTDKIDTTDTTQLVKLYEKLLPYAMLFGIEQDWAKEFAGLYQESPDWYSSSGSFSAGYFVGSLNGFGAATTTSFSPPSSSGSGGSAGGGGGGGGGGGW
ncbi:MAG: hypothetical protein JWN01_749 [Patescibacteria group bacterium]|nr:hypothetical protein [Patescibacteria group bacterium]